MDPAAKPTKLRVIYQLRSSGVPQQTANKLRSGTHYRGYLPHVKKEGASYFVTFRLADSLPQDVLRKFQGERDERIRRLGCVEEEGRLQTGDTAGWKPALRVKAGCKPGDTAGWKPALRDLQEIEREYRREFERYLDKGVGACWLKRPEIAEVVKGALQHFQGQRYELSAWVVMPNHVHVVVWPMPNQLLNEILHSWKRFIARQANQILGRVGQEFWQPETYDHWIRDEEEKVRIVRYISNNPVKAGLCSAPERWRWSSAFCEASKEEEGRLQTGGTAG